jgi:hypothetical protein
MIAGLFLAVAIICTHVFQTQKFDSKHAKKTEQKSEQKSENAFVSAPTIIPSASVNIHTNLFAYCIFEIPEPQSTDESSADESSLRPEKLLLTLFRVIISPNAP